MRNIQALDADPSEGGLFLCRMQTQRSREADRKEKHEHELRKKAEESEEVREKARYKGTRVDVHRLSESAPENWRDVLDRFHLQWACSPLHDRDVNATGEPKKAHWHILLSFGGKRATGKSGAFQRLLTAHVRRSAKTKKSVDSLFQPSG